MVLNIDVYHERTDINQLIIDLYRMSVIAPIFNSG